LLSKNQLKYFASLKQKKYRISEGRFLVEGLRLCEELLSSDYKTETLLYCPQKLSSPRAEALLAHARRKNIPTVEIDARALKRLTDTEAAQGVVAVAHRKTFHLNDVIDAARGPVLAVDRVRDPGNLGTLLRTAAWFGAVGVLMSRDSVELTNPKVVRSTMGALFYLPVVTELDLTAVFIKLRDSATPVLVADVRDGTVYWEVAFSPRGVLVVGNEASGVSPTIRQMATQLVRIPRYGRSESLNVAVAAGVILSEWRRKLHV